MTDGDREFERQFPGQRAIDVFPMDGTEKSCPRCNLEFKTLLHPFCQHRYCPPRDSSQRESRPQAKAASRDAGLSSEILECASMKLGSVLCGHCNKLHRSSSLCDCEGAKAERTRHLDRTLDMMRNPDRAVLAVGQPLSPQDPPTVIIGLPDSVWLKFQSGQTVDFDLRNAGVFANLVIVRGKDGADIARLLGQSQAALDGAPFVGVEERTKQ